MSGGFAVHEDHIYTLGDRINTAYSTLKNTFMIEDEKLVDVTIGLAHISDVLLRTLDKLGPFGMGNPKPIFKFENVIPSRVISFGKGNEHLKLIFETEEDNREAIAFFTKAEDYSIVPKEGTPMNLLAHVEESFFMNKRNVRMRIVDIIE